MPGTFSPSPQVSDPDMHHGTCITHVPWCMPRSLTSGFHGGGGKTFPVFPAQFCVSGKRLMIGATSQFPWHRSQVITTDMKIRFEQINLLAPNFHLSLGSNYSTEMREHDSQWQIPPPKKRKKQTSKKTNKKNNKKTICLQTIHLKQAVQIWLVIPNTVIKSLQRTP